MLFTQVKFAKLRTYRFFQIEAELLTIYFEASFLNKLSQTTITIDEQSQVDHDVKCYTSE